MNSDQVTVLVFKDNHASRTFQISLRWITHLGLWLGACALITVISLFLTIKYYRAAHQGDPARIQHLEHQLAEMSKSYKGLESRYKRETSDDSANPSDAELAQIPQQAQADSSSHSPQTAAQTVALTQKASTTLPAPPANTSNLPFTLAKPKLNWRGNTLFLNSNLQYTAEDGGSQQGRIILLARGPDMLMAHPEGVLNAPGADALFTSSRGEYFSVSRYREISAQFGPIAVPSRIQHIEAMIFNTSGKLLMVEKFEVPSYRSPLPAGAAKEKRDDASNASSM